MKAEFTIRELRELGVSDKRILDAIQDKTEVSSLDRIREKSANIIAPNGKKVE